MQSDLLLREFRQFRAEVLARLDAMDPLHGEALLEQVLQRLAARGLPVQFSVRELQAEHVVTAAQAHRLKYSLRELLAKRAGIVGDFEVSHARPDRGGWVYELRRLR
jgi:hypothetical protein